MVVILQTIKKDRSAQVAVAAFLLFSLWWIFLSQTPADSVWHSWFAGLYGLVALWGGINGFLIARDWGLFKSTMGKALLALSIGLLFQEFGQLAYSYYLSVMGIEVPYPSIGDIGYFGSIPLYTLGIIFLGQAVGVQLSLKSFINKFKAVGVVAVILAVSYALFLRGYEFDWGQPLKVFLDFGYPLGQAIYISLALVTYLLTREKLGGVMKNRVLFVLAALFFQFLADYNFLYQASNQTWSVSGYGDYMYLFAYFLMALALIQLRTTLKNLRVSAAAAGAVNAAAVASADLAKYAAAILSVIKEQKLVLGPLAEDLASKVGGLSYAAGAVSITAEPKTTLANLIEEYSKLFGQTSVEVSKNAIKKSGQVFSPAELPDSLK